MHTAQPNPAQRPPETEQSARHPRPAWRELLLVLSVTGVYFLTRGVIRGRTADAILHANQILSLERTLHLDPEQALQHFVLAHEWLLDAANLFYLVGHLPVLIAVALWLYFRYPKPWRFFRNAFGLSALVGLTIYMVFPVAPPRFMPGFIDTMQEAGVGLDGSAVGLLYNPYAAMPSLHVGWALMAGIALIVCARAWWLRVAGGALPILMTLTVLVTGNHYLLDVLAGVAVAGVALALAWWLAWFEERKQWLKVKKKE